MLQARRRHSRLKEWRPRLSILSRWWSAKLPRRRPAEERQVRHSRRVSVQDGNVKGTGHIFAKGLPFARPAILAHSPGSSMAAKPTEKV